jgi:ADP-ribosyltransferase exoenzyme
VTSCGMQLTDLTKQEMAALHAYKAATGDHTNSFPFDINEMLESGLWTDELPEKSREYVVALDKVFARCPSVTDRLTAYRGISSTSRLGFPVIGRKFRSLAFWSASTSRSVATSFVRPQFPNSTGGILVLEISVGTVVYDMETLTGAGRAERELLLPRGLLWEITDSKKGEISEIPLPARNNLRSLGILTLKLVSPTSRPLS